MINLKYLCGDFEVIISYRNGIEIWKEFQIENYKFGISIIFVIDLKILQKLFNLFFYLENKGVIF